jgi:uncharacterized membrane protein
MNARRTEALSDSTFAVAMTLLIFDLRVMASTQHTLSYYIWYSAWPHYLGYAVSFLIIGTIWISHHTIFRLINGVDHRAMVLNLGLLGLVVFIPFPTEILAIYINQNSLSERAQAAALYGLSLAVATLMLALLWHSFSHHRRLIKSWVSDDELRRLTRRFYLTPVLYLIATGVALFDATIGVILFLAVGCGYLLHTGTQAAPIHPDDAINRAGIPYDPPAGTRPDEGPSS